MIYFGDYNRVQLPLMLPLYETHHLPNGLRLILAPMEGVSSVTVLAMVGVGSRYETEEQAGIAHFLEHMVFKGTQNYPTAMDISGTIDGIGGQYNAFTGKDYTGYYAKVASEHLELAVDVISDMLLTPKLQLADIEREKGVIIEEMNMYEDDPRRKIDDVYDSVIYGKSDLGREIIGYKKTVRSFGEADFRDFLDSWYDLHNVVVVIAGDAQKIKKSKIKTEDMITKAFSKGKKRSGKGAKDFVVPVHKNPQVKVVHKKTEQAHFYLGFPGLPRDHADRFGQLVLSNFLGGNSSARLFNEIREKRGLAYYAYASSESYADVGSIYAFEGVDPTRVDQALTVTVEEFMKASQGDVTQIEVDRTKEYLRGKLILDWEDSQSVASSYARRALLSAEMESLDHILEGIAQVDIDQVKGLAKKLFNFNQVNLALIGPYEKEDGRFLQILTKNK